MHSMDLTEPVATEQEAMDPEAREPAATWVVLAHILRPQGRRGEVLAELFTDFPGRFDEQPRVWLAQSGFAERRHGGAGAETLPRPVEVLSHWLPVGRNAGRIVLHFAGVESIEQAEQLAGLEVVVPRSERMDLEPGAAYISDLVGCTVYDGGVALGVVESVQFPASPDGSRRLEDAAPLLAVTAPGGEELLVPFARAYLVEMDLPAKALRMTLPEGLAEINRRME
jgi:16S rRNA processing protein RimM